MSVKESHPTDVDIDPGWYPGQTELEDEPGAAPEQLQQGGEAATGVAVIVGVGAPSNPLSVPTVLKKLQKWGDYDSVGAQVLPTKFIPMKTPLSAEILDNWSLPSQPKHRLTVPEMVAQQAALGRKVGLLLDLSNHDCLYSADIPADLAYTHVQLVAKELPPPEFVDAVVAVVNKFWAQHPDEYIAVHCAYGFNRTGFVVCCYLIECCGLSVEEALTAFAESRPPGVKHEQFRAELHRRYSSATYGAAAHGVYGSPDDNSSFGYSPSCGSLDLRDLCSGGGSPVPGLTRGYTFDCVLASHHTAAAAAAAGSSGGNGGSPCGYRRSLDGHQTLTFTTSSFVRRGSGGGGQKPPTTLAAAAAAPRPVQPLLPALPQSPQPQEHGGQEEQQLREGSQREQQLRGVRESREEQEPRGGPQSQQSAQQAGQRADDERERADGVSGGQHGACVERQHRGREAESAAAEPVTAAATDGGSGGSSRVATQQPQPPCCNDNESLGVNDRQLLQTLRQHAQMSATIPEESGSAHSTPVRGCSSISLADCDSTPGHSTPRPAPPGKFSHKSLDSIDWGAAAAPEASGDVAAKSAGPPVPAFEAPQLN